MKSGRKRAGGNGPLWKRIYRRLVLVNDSPGRVAGGVAIGVLTGVAPTFGLGGIVAVGLAALLRCNIAAALLGAATGAPPFIFLIWLVSSYAGAFMLGIKVEGIYELVRAGEVLEAGGKVMTAYLLGNVLVTALLSGLSYVAVLHLLKARARRKRKP